YVRCSCRFLRRLFWAVLRPETHRMARRANPVEGTTTDACNPCQPRSAYLGRARSAHGAPGRPRDRSRRGRTSWRHPMRLMRTLTAVACAAALATLAATGTGAVGGRPFTTHLVGANEVPVTGDPDASRTAHLWIYPCQGRLFC